MNQFPHARPNDVIAAMDRTPYGAILRDESRRRQMVYEAMMAGPDPIGREIGQQLLSGAVAPRELLAVANYREFFGRARTDAERLEVEALAASARALAGEGQLTGDLGREADIAATDRPSAAGRPERSEERRR